jgi:hypothetical protein
MPFLGERKMFDNPCPLDTAENISDREYRRQLREIPANEVYKQLNALATEIEINEAMAEAGHEFHALATEIEINKAMAEAGHEFLAYADCALTNPS